MPISIFIFVFVQVLVVSFYDVKTMKISNYWSIINLIIYILFLFLYPKFYLLNFETFIYPLGIFTMGFFLFLLKIMGGGDSKYLSSLFFLIPFKLHQEYLMSVIIITIIIGSIIFVKNIFSNLNLIIINWKGKDFKNIFGSKFAYAPIICIAWMVYGWKIKEKLFF